MHGIKENDFYTSEYEKDEFKRKLSKGYEILDKFIHHLNASKQSFSNDVINDTKIQKLLELSSALIIFMGEFPPAWSFRRWYLAQLINQNVSIDILEDSIKLELKLLNETMQKHSKFYATWQHRLLIISQIANKLPQSSYDIILKDELSFIDKLLSVDDRNFHCWRYIMYLKHIIPNLSFNNLTYPQYLTYLIREDFSNFSAWHERSLLDTFDLNDEINILHEAIYTDPEDSSIWAYYKHILTKKSPLFLLKSYYIQDIPCIYLMFSDFINLKIDSPNYKLESIEGNLLKFPSTLSRVWKITGNFDQPINVNAYINNYNDYFYKRLLNYKEVVNDYNIQKFIIYPKNHIASNIILDQDLVESELDFINELLTIEPDSIYLTLAKIFLFKHSKHSKHSNHIIDDIIKCYDKLIILDPIREKYYRHEKSLSLIKSIINEVSIQIDLSNHYLSGIPYDLSVILFGCKVLILSNCSLTSYTIDGWHIPLIQTLEILDISNNKLTNLNTLKTRVELLDVRNNPFDDTITFPSEIMSFTSRNPNLKIIILDNPALTFEGGWVISNVSNLLSHSSVLSPLILDYIRKLDDDQLILTLY